MKKVTINSRMIPLLIAGIEQNHGIESKRLAEMLGMSWPHVKKGLACLNQHKIASYCEMGKLKRGWFPWAEAEKRNAGFMSRKALERFRAEQRPPSIRSQILEMAEKEEDGASPAKISERLGLSEHDAHRHCYAMVKQGRLFVASREGFRLRWFASVEAVKIWESLPAREQSESRPRHSEKRKEAAREAARLAREERAKQRLVAATERLRSKARQPSKAPPKLAGSRCNAIPLKPGLAPTVTVRGMATNISGQVDYSKAKLTVCPSPGYDARYQLPPNAKVQGEFSRQWEQLRGAA